MTRRDRTIPNDLAEALAGEMIGATLRIESHPGLSHLPLEGTIVDESLETFLVRLPGHGRIRRIAKSGAEGTILLDERPLPLRGNALRVRPEDRPKRLLGRGRWSYA
ncbi:MAG: ribonuclease P protein subunit [Thermoplasmata archaeon]|nr:ribonuclease P protein subunit [Thermoplasmata archaeon]